MVKSLKNTKITALYERLSKDDIQKGDSSNSIINQKEILEKYAARHGFSNIRHFTDDGVSGTIFQRPGLDEMVEEIKAGNVSTVIIKDQSRIGRDVVEVGLLKRTFDEYDVRFIAAEDDLDTAKGFDIMSLFRDVINEFYVADTSKKIKAVFKSRMERGLRCSGSISYGYVPDPNDINTWHIDERAAAVVRRIFQMTIDGKGISEIGRILRAEQIPIPSEHWKRMGMPVRAAKYADPYAWSGTTIGYILKKPEYMGRKVLGKTVKENYKAKRHRKTDPDEQYVFDGAVPAIVDEETWHNAQRLRKTVRRPPKKEGPPHRLTGLLFCADCGSKLTHRRNMVQGKYFDDACVCSGYRQLTRDCTMHYIPTRNVELLILSAIQRIIIYVKENEKEFIQKVREASAIQQEEAAKACNRKLKQTEKRYAELDGLVKKLYEQNASGKLSDRHYERLLAEYDNEQATLEVTIAELQTQINIWSEDKLKTEKFIELVKRYTDFSELTTPMLNQFVERVVVHESNSKRGNDRRQRVDIHMNFIGAFAVPIDIVTPVELQEQQRREEERLVRVKRLQEGYKAKYEKKKEAMQDYYARKSAGLLTPEEQEAEELRLAKRREYNKAWREKRQAEIPPKLKKLSVTEIDKRRKEGLPITDEELERYTAWRKNKNATHNAWYHRRRAEIIANTQPKEHKPTKKERMKDISSRLKSGLPVTTEEQESYAAFRAERNEKHRIWRESEARSNSGELVIYDIQKRMRDGVALTQEESEFYEDWKAKKNEERRQYYHKKKAEMAQAVGQ